MHRILSWIGMGIAIISFVLVLGGIGAMVEGKEDSSMIIGIILFLSGVIGGFWMYRSNSRKWKNKLAEEREQKLLGMIAAGGGRITPAEVALQTRLSLEKSKAALDELCVKGMGQLNLTEKGNMVYVFEGFLSEEEKDTAKSPLDI